MSVILNKQMILQAFKDIAMLVKAEDSHGTIYLVGSAAVIMSYDDKLETLDVDAV